MILSEKTVQFPGGKGEKAVVEPDDSAQGPVIGPKFFQGSIPEIFLKLLLQQMPVRSPPTVDRLLDIPDNEVPKPSGLAVFQQRTEIFPLDSRSVLEFVQKEIFKADSEFFIDKRGIAAVYDLTEDLI